MLRAVGFRSSIAAYLPTMQSLLQRTIDPWLESGTALDVRADLQRFAARLTGALYTGDLSEEHAAELGNAMPTEPLLFRAAGARALSKGAGENAVAVTRSRPG